MCGRFANHVSAMHHWVTLLKDWPAGMPTGYNVAPAQVVPVLNGHGVCGMRWGLVPAWSKEASPQYATFNARLETVADKPTFRAAWRSKRNCAVPVQGYFEWQASASGKQPYFVCADEGEGPLVMAGLWEERAGELSFTVLTEPAGEGMAELHHRVPVILTPETASAWLAGEQSIELLKEGVNRMSLRWYAVSRLVNNARNQGEDLIKPDPERTPGQAK